MGVAEGWSRRGRAAVRHPRQRSGHATDRLQACQDSAWASSVAASAGWPLPGTWSRPTRACRSSCWTAPTGRAASCAAAGRGGPHRPRGRVGAGPTAEAVELAAAVGLDDRIVHPAAGTAAIWSRGALHPMPTGTLMGVPGDPGCGAGSPGRRRGRPGRARARPVAPAGRVRRLSVGDYVAVPARGPRSSTASSSRCWVACTPGTPARLSLQAAVPAPLGGRAVGESIVGRRRARPRPPRRPHGGPVFAGLSGGVCRAGPDARRSVAPSPRRARSCTRHDGAGGSSAPVTGGGWSVGSVPAPERLVADAVVLAVPAAPAARLLGTCAPAPRGSLGEIDYASMAIVTLALAADGRRAAARARASSCRRSRAATIKAAHLQLHQVGAGPAQAPATCPSCGPRSAGTARRRRPAALRRRARGRRRVADLCEALGPPAAAPRRQPTSSAGAGRCRSTPSGHVDRVARIRAAGRRGSPGLEVGRRGIRRGGDPGVHRLGRARQPRRR